jgi:RNA recognition motif-containing protein
MVRRRQIRLGLAHVAAIHAKDDTPEQININPRHPAYDSSRRWTMTTFEKRAREDKRDQKARNKAERRLEKRNQPTRQPEIISASDVVGNLQSIESVMQSLEKGGDSRAVRRAPSIPVKLFVGSLNDHTTSAGLRAHFEPYGAIEEAVVITQRGTTISRNFGFVTMADRKDGPAAISALHHSELDGNVIVVNVATENR